jgi:ferrous iron transport protein A
MADPKKSIADMSIGERGVICCFQDEDMSLKLLEMGCLPGTEVKMSNKTPFGGPVCIKVSGYALSLRKDEAATIMIR